MARATKISYRFVDAIPRGLESGVIYISIEYGTVVHACCCGCGEEVVTPLSPTDWKLIFDGETISLYPSVGNWSFTCRSHYWIHENRVHWARSWTEAEIAAGRSTDSRNKDEYFEQKTAGGSYKSRGWSRFLRIIDPRTVDVDAPDDEE